MPRSKRDYKKTLMHHQECINKTLKQIRKTNAYKQLIPFGVAGRKNMNSKHKYHFGNKSTMRKGDLCEALSDPKKYHAKIKRNYGTGKKKGARKMKNSSKRKRYSRTGDCRPFSGPNKRTPPCSGSHKNSGLTTTAKKCCYKKAQSAATKAKRRRNSASKKTSIRKYNSKRGITQKSTGSKRKRSKKRKLRLKKK